MPKNNADWHSLDSSLVSAAKYEKGELHVQYKRDGFVAAYKVPEPTFEAMITAGSVGQFVRKRLFPLPYRKV